MKKLKLFLATLGFVAAGFTTFGAVPAVGALAPLGDAVCPAGSTSEICKNKDEKLQTTVTDLIQTLLFIVGLLAVLMIIVSGILYVVSTGDAPKVAKAKNTLTYSIVGLVVALLAFAIISWVEGLL